MTPGRVESGLGALRLAQVDLRDRFLQLGDCAVVAKGIIRLGASQRFEMVFNPASRHNNVAQPLNVRVG